MLQATYFFGRFHRLLGGSYPWNVRHTFVVHGRNLSNSYATLFDNIIAQQTMSTGVKNQKQKDPYNNFFLEGTFICILWLLVWISTYFDMVIGHLRTGFWIV